MNKWSFVLHCMQFRVEKSGFFFCVESGNAVSGRCYVERVILCGDFCIPVSYFAHLCLLRSSSLGVIIIEAVVYASKNDEQIFSLLRSPQYAISSQYTSKDAVAGPNCSCSGTLCHRQSRRPPVGLRLSPAHTGL